MQKLAAQIYGIELFLKTYFLNKLIKSPVLQLCVL